MAASSFADRVSVATATTGTGTMTLGSATSGFAGVTALTNATLYSYAIIDGTNWEVGQGTYTTSGTTLTRTTVDASSAGGTTKITLSGAATVIITFLTRDIANLALITGTYTPTIAFGGASVGVTYSVQSGAYIKFSNGMVHVMISLALTSKGSSTGQFSFSLPVACVGTGGQDNVLGTPVWNLITWPANAGQAASAGAGTSNGFLYAANTTAGGGAALDNTAFSNTSILRISGMYQG